MGQKIIFLDVDGTLVDYENRLPHSALRALEKARKAGHLIYLATGRSKAELYGEISQVTYDGYIGGNGSYIEVADQVVKEETLSYEETKAVVDWLEARQLEFYLEANSGLYGSRNFEKRGQPTMQAYSKSKGKEITTVKEAFPELILGADLYRSDINKISFILDSYQDYLDACLAFSELKLGTWGGVGEEALFGDVARGNINKGNAVSELLAHLGIDGKDSLAFGDAKVDIPMLDVAGVGVAMGNGGPEIQAMADFITKDVNEDGIWHAFEYFDLL